MDRPTIIETDVAIAPHTTLRVGGTAKFFASPKTDDEVQQVIRWARAERVPFRIIGRGANLLVADRGYQGLIIVMRNDQMEWTPPSVVVGAGVQNGQLIAAALKHGLGGMRWLIGVPGTVGGSLYGNAGGHGWGLGDQVMWVDCLDAQTDLRRLSAAECNFAYRTSTFKQHPEWIILRAGLTFPPIDPAAERLLLAETTKQKNSNQPTTEKTAGCMFTNPMVGTAKLPDHLRSAVDANGTIAAWRLIDAVGLKGHQLGQIAISDKHCNFMINLGDGTADQVVQLLSLVKQRVRDTYGIQLHEEVQYLGFE